MSIVRVAPRGKRMTREFRPLVAGHRLAAVGRGDLSNGAENKGWWLKTAARQNTAGKICCFCPFSLFSGGRGGVWLVAWVASVARLSNLSAGNELSVCVCEGS